MHNKSSEKVCQKLFENKVDDVIYDKALNLILAPSTKKRRFCRTPPDIEKGSIWM